MAKLENSDKTQRFYRVKLPFTAMLVGWWDGPPVIVLVPSTETICIREKPGPTRVTLKIPTGPIRGFALTEERKRFLLDQGMHLGLIERGCVLDVSDSFASQYKEEREAIASLAAQCGLNQGELDKILEAKKKLASFTPSNHTERIAKRALESLFKLQASKKKAGRPERISAEERRELRQRAKLLETGGKSRSDIVAQFAEEYELRLSYIRRILEDRHKDESQ
jgi:hypothetical protein